MIFAALGLIGLVLAFGSLNAQAGSAAAHRDAGLASLAVMFACGGWLTRIMWRDTGARLGLGARRPSRRR